MPQGFRNRREAGRILADRLLHYADADVIVLALPRGGVPVGHEIARSLRAPLDVYVVRKLGVPGHEELAMGAIAPRDARVLNEDVVADLGVTEEDIARVAAQETKELNRREQLYRGERPPLDVEGQTVVLVDDGLATGSTMRAAIMALRAQQPSRIVVAVPVGASQICADLEREADEVVCALRPERMGAISLFYDDFSQTTDEEVRSLLEEPEHQESHARTP